MSKSIIRGLLVLLVVAALTALIPSLSIARKPAEIKRTPVRRSLSFEGKALYNELCAVCHGAGGQAMAQRQPR